MHLPENHSGATSDQQLVGLWLSGRPDPTVAMYRPVAERFLTHLASLGKTLQLATVSDAVAWFETLDGSDATRNRKVSTIKSLTGYAYRTGYCVFDIGRALRCPKPLRKLQERIAAPETVQEVIREAEQGRDQILARFLYVSGCRISEACNVRFVDLRGNRVTLKGKGRKVRTVLIPDELAKELQKLRWSKDTQQSFVFKSFRGNRLNERDARAIVKQAAQEAGTFLTPHWLRHSHATHSLDNGCPIHVLQLQMGHENVATTSLYLHANPKQGSSQYL